MAENAERKTKGNERLVSLAEPHKHKIAERGGLFGGTLHRKKPGITAKDRLTRAKTKEHNGPAYNRFGTALASSASYRPQAGPRPGVVDNGVTSSRSSSFSVRDERTNFMSQRLSLMAIIPNGRVSKARLGRLSLPRIRVPEGTLKIDQVLQLTNISSSS